MANQIDITYFIREVNLPGSYTEEITSYISRFEPEILNKVLGYDLKKAYLAGIAQAIPLQKWKDLRDGKEWTDSEGIYHKWMGFTNSDKVSLIAYYVFFKYLIHGSRYNSSNGIFQPENENAIVLSPVQKQIDIWNLMVDQFKELDLFIKSANYFDSTTYPNYDPFECEYLNIFGI